MKIIFFMIITYLIENIYSLIWSILGGPPCRTPQPSPDMIPGKLPGFGEGMRESLSPPLPGFPAIDTFKEVLKKLAEELPGLLELIDVKVYIYSFPVILISAASLIFKLEMARIDPITGEYKSREENVERKSAKQLMEDYINAHSLYEVKTSSEDFSISQFRTKSFNIALFISIILLSILIIYYSSKEMPFFYAITADGWQMPYEVSPGRLAVDKRPFKRTILFSELATLIPIIKEFFDWQYRIGRRYGVYKIWNTKLLAWEHYYIDYRGKIVKNTISFLEEISWEDKLIKKRFK